MKRTLIGIISSVLMIVPEFVQACAVCFGDPNSPLTIGAKAGVMLMFGILAIVLGGIFAAVIYFVRRARIVEVQAILKGETSSSSSN